MVGTSGWEWEAVGRHLHARHGLECGYMMGQRRRGRRLASDWDVGGFASVSPPPRMGTVRDLEHAV